MSEVLHLDLNERQRDILLRGLRFVRSSRMMEFRELSEPDDDTRKRADDLAEIRRLAELLDRKSGATQAATA